MRNRNLTAMLEEIKNAIAYALEKGTSVINLYEFDKGLGGISSESIRFELKNGDLVRVNILKRHDDESKNGISE